MDESEAIKSLISTIDESFEKVIELILSSKGKIVVTGVGKSAIIGQKIAATLNSTGQKAVFMHATDAVHGDLGIVEGSDIILFLSKSGNTSEIKVLIPVLKRIVGTKIIALISEMDSYLASNADFILNAHVEKEACPLNLAPTTSTTAALAMGDALAVCLLTTRKFSRKDFADYHPGGSLGKKLYLRVDDLYTNHALPMVEPHATLREVIFEISSKRLGATSVVDDAQHLIGIITDGDLRRMLDRHLEIDKLKAIDIMTSTPKTIDVGEYAVNALLKMQDLNITQLIVVNGRKVKGFVHLHDLLKEGLG